MPGLRYLCRPTKKLVCTLSGRCGSFNPVMKRIQFAKEGSRGMAQFVEKAGHAKIVVEHARYHSVVLTASADFLMKWGLGKEVLYRCCHFDVLRRTEPDPGNLVVCKHYNHFVYFLITRKRWFEYGTYNNLWDALIALRNHCDENSVKKILMGRLGDEDHLEWEKVRTLFSSLFSDSDANFTIYSRTDPEDIHIATYDNIMDVSRNQVIQGVKVT